MDSNKKNFSIRCMHIYRLKGCIQSWYCTYCLIFIFIFILERHSEPCALSQSEYCALSQGEPCALSQSENRGCSAAPWVLCSPVGALQPRGCSKNVLCPRANLVLFPRAKPWVLCSTVGAPQPCGCSKREPVGALQPGGCSLLCDTQLAHVGPTTVSLSVPNSLYGSCWRHAVGTRWPNCGLSQQPLGCSAAPWVLCSPLGALQPLGCSAAPWMLCSPLGALQPLGCSAAPWMLCSPNSNVHGGALRTPSSLL
jgi:hypothetical protein